MNPIETEGSCGSDEVEGKEIDRAMTGDHRSSCLTLAAQSRDRIPAIGCVPRKMEHAIQLASSRIAEADILTFLACLTSIG